MGLSNAGDRAKGCHPGQRLSSWPKAVILSAAKDLVSLTG